MILSEMDRCRPRQREGEFLVGLLAGEGVGPELVGHCRRVAEALEVPLRWETGGEIGLPAIRRGGSALSSEVQAFCEDIFARGGAIFSGPGGERYVYELRQRFQLFYKLNPIRTVAPLADVAPVRGRGAADIMVVRETSSGPYHCEETVAHGDVTLRYTCTRAEVERVTEVAARLAKQRRGELAVVFKQHGQPLLGRLWVDCARQACEAQGVRCQSHDPDYCAYLMLSDPGLFDVVVTSNDLGDVLADLGGLLMGSRGMTFGACYSQEGHAVYQTNHGSAHALCGQDVANPAGQLFSLAMLLRVSLQLEEPARRLEAAMERVWGRMRTPDLAAPDRETVGTARWMAELLEELQH